MRAAFILLIVLIVPSMPAHALTGDELLTQCSAPVASLERTHCNGYVVGVASGATMLTIGLRQLHPGNAEYPMMFCIASSVSAEQLVDAAVKYLRANPGNRHFDAASELLLAFQGEFPCYRR